MAETRRPWLRRAGRATLDDGRVLLFSVAEGRRGRRWRASTRSAAGLLDDLLLEVDPEGRFDRLELTTPIGQLTFHPEPDRNAAHGNLVAADGVRHLALPWSPEHAVAIPSSPVADAALALGAGVLVGGERDLGVGIVGADLIPRSGVVSVRRLGEWQWSVGGRLIEVDQEGLPVVLDRAAWPLEEAAD